MPLLDTRFSGWSYVARMLLTGLQPGFPHGGAWKVRLKPANETRPARNHPLKRVSNNGIGVDVPTTRLPLDFNAPEKAHWPTRPQR